MNILVTGGAGFIGSNLTDALLARGDSVTVVDNFNDYYSPEQKKKNLAAAMKNKKFNLVKADITDANSLDKAFAKAKPERVVHLAARVGVRPSIKDPSLYYEANVKGTLNVLDLCKKYSVKNLVFASSSSVYGSNKKIPFSEDDKTDKPISPYAATKKAGELLAYSYHNLHKQNIICLRFFTVYGERGRPDMAPLKFTKLISEGQEVQIYGDGHSKRDYTYVGDIVQGVMSALDRELGYEIINLGNSQSVELMKLIETIEKETGKKAKLKFVSEQQGDIGETFADITKAKRILGFVPRTKIQEGIKRLVSWYNQQN